MTQTEIADSESNSQAAELPTQLVDIFKALAENESIVFKSQQIDDPELNLLEKQQIVQEAFNKNRENFLIRFGSHLDDGQLNELQSLAIKEPIKPDESLEDIRLLLDDFKRKLHTRSICVKNRRYQAMEQLLQKGEYFSEHEMMQRAPELYQELVGQYLTEAEKKQRDSYDVRNTSFSGILMHTLEQRQRDELLQQIDTSLREEQETTTPMAAPLNDCDVPDACRQQWGGFADDEPVACSTSRNIGPPAGRITTAEYYNPAERELLRNEFMGLMKERFLSGQDQDFDYASVDDNAQLDDLKQIERDEEDAYFESSDNDDDHNKEEVRPVAPERRSSNDEDEDELDVYMRHLNKHPSLQH
ncbi:coiled-coil domain-containing protein 97 [Drosophila grimshawi]|uniref:GH10177 n=1 Tax=Drosophila grimshawi TaxID=7222 RepID=B4JBW2_DROGR|nr:coiled-coil domain-containing protein 97 [Drosophila grimshawi]EDW04065.1 GH10177 [Drosophila grimshawi]